MFVWVKVEVELDDAVLSVIQEDRLVYDVPSGRSGAAVQTLGTAVGKMIAALGADSDTPSSVLMVEFHKAVVRSARSATPAPGHTCDGVGCC